MRKTLTDRGVAALKPRPKRYHEPDPQLPTHYVRVEPSNAKSFWVVPRTPDGVQKWTKTGEPNLISIEVSRQIAREVIRRVRAGLPAFEPPPVQPDSFEAVAKLWLERHAKAKGLRSQKQIERLLRVHVLPVWASREFLSIKRSDVAALLDDVQDDHGARQADCVLVVVRSVMNWYAARNDGYMPPIVRGMRRENPKERERKRVLSDDELRAIWRQAEANGTFGAILRLCLLTAQRSRKVSTMKWSDVALDGVWTIPTAPREKDSAGSLPLPEAALAIIRQQPRLGSNPYVFAGRGQGPFAGFSQAKTRFDATLSAMEPWVIHDLRRTARSLMSRAGVQSEIAEIVMGHALGGVKGVYDRHSYRDEKADALRKLAALIDSIVNPRKNVVPIRGATRHDNVAGDAG